MKDDNNRLIIQLFCLILFVILVGSLLVFGEAFVRKANAYHSPDPIVYPQDSANEWLGEQVTRWCECNVDEVNCDPSCELYFGSPQCCCKVAK